MSKFNVTLTFDTEQTTPEQAAEQLAAFAQMTEALSHEELIITANFMSENPQAIQQIKEWIINPPAMLKLAHKALFK